jgi:DNA-directed RNA polymerase specialized sigma subunit
VESLEKQMDKQNARTKKKLKQISSVKEFEELLERTMLSDDEKEIFWKIYKEQKPLSVIADEMGMALITVQKKHHNMLMKIGRMI